MTVRQVHEILARRNIPIRPTLVHAMKLAGIASLAVARPTRVHALPAVKGARNVYVTATLSLRFHNATLTAESKALM